MQRSGKSRDQIANIRQLTANCVAPSSWSLVLRKASAGDPAPGDSTLETPLDDDVAGLCAAEVHGDSAPAPQHVSVLMVPSAVINTIQNSTCRKCHQG